MSEGSGSGLGSRLLLSVMAVDPGGWTGVQIANVPLLDGRLRYGAAESLNRARALQMTFGTEIREQDWREHVNLLHASVLKTRQWVAAKAEEIGYDGYEQVLIVEGFVGGEGALAGDPFSPVRIEACLAWMLSDVVESYVVPQPAEMASIPDSRLRLWGWHRPGAVHLNDARRHLFNYLRRREISSA